MAPSSRLSGLFLIVIFGAVGYLIVTRTATTPSESRTSSPRSTTERSDVTAGVTPAVDEASAPSITDDSAPLPAWRWGVVHNQDGNPVADAEVFLWVDSGRYRLTRIAATTRTDSRGRYTLRGRAGPDDLYAAVQIRRPDYEIASPAKVNVRRGNWGRWFEPGTDFDDDRQPITDTVEPGTTPPPTDARLESEVRPVVLVDGVRFFGTVDAPAPELQGATILPGGWPVNADGSFVAWYADAETEVGAVTPRGGWASSVGPGAIELTPRRDPKTITVVDDAGPVAGVIVRTTPHSAKWLSVDVLTDSDGRVTLVDIEESSVRVVSPSHASEVVDDEQRAAGVAHLAAAGWLTLQLVPVTPIPRFTGRGRGFVFERRAHAYRSHPIEAIESSERIEWPGYLPSHLSWTPGPIAHRLGLITLDAGAAITIDVVDPEGVAVVGARVAHQRKRATTDARGRARLAPFPRLGVVTLSVSADGWAAARRDVEVNAANEHITIQLDPQATLSMTVASSSGNPIVAEVSSWSHTIEFETESDGRVSSQVVPAHAEIQLYVASAEDQSRFLVVRPLHPGEHRDLGVVTLDAAARVAVLVRDDNGRPVENAAVHAESSTMNSYATTDTKGECVVTGLSTGRYRITAYESDDDGAACALPQIVELTLDEVPQLEFQLPATRSHTLTVVSQTGDPVEGADVNFSWRGGIPYLWGTTDENGLVEVDGLFEGVWVIDVDSGTHRSFEQTVSTLKDLPTVITLVRAPTLVVTFEADEELDGHDLQLYVGEHELRSEVIELDQVRFEGLTPGAAEVSFRCRDAQSPTYPITLPDNGDDVYLAIDLQRALTRGVLEVIVVNHDGRTVHRARVVANEQSSGSNADGVIAVEYIEEPGWITIVIDGVARIRIDDPVAKAIDGRLTVTAGPAGRLRVRLVDGGTGHEQPWADSTRIELSPPHASTDPRVLGGEGLVAEHSLATGNWSLATWWLDEEVDRREILIKPGIVTEVVVSLPPAFPVEGRITSQDRIHALLWQRVGALANDVSMTVAEDGTYAGRLRVAGEYLVTSMGSRGLKTRTVSVDGAARLDFDFGGRRTGRVVVHRARLGSDLRCLFLTNTVIAGAEVANDGTFSVNSLPAGSYEWILSSRRSSWIHREVIVIPTDDDPIYLAVAKTRPLAVHVLNPRIGQELSIGYLYEGSYFLADTAGRAPHEPSLAPKGSALVPSYARQIVVTDQTGRSAFVEREPGVESVQVELLPGGTVDLSRFHLDRTHLIEFQPVVGSISQSFTAHLGTLAPRMSGSNNFILPVGEYRLTFRYHDAVVTRTVVVVEDETTVVEPE